MRNNRKVKALRAKFGLQGYAVWAMMLECLTDESGFALEWDEANCELIAGDFGLDADQLRPMVEYMIKIGLLHLDGLRLSSKAHKARMQFVIDDRERKRSWKEQQKQPRFPIVDGENGIVDGENAQSKVKERKGKETLPNGNAGDSPAHEEEFSKNINPPPPHPAPAPLEGEENTPHSDHPAACAADTIREAVMAWVVNNPSAYAEMKARFPDSVSTKRQILAEFERFVARHLGKDDYRAKIISNPVLFFREQFPGWLLLPAAGNASQPRAPDKPWKAQDWPKSAANLASELQKSHPGLDFSPREINRLAAAPNEITYHEWLHGMVKTKHNGAAQPRSNATQILHPLNTALA